jgi:hypothetical protein
MFRVIVSRECVFEVTLLVERVIVVVVIKRMDMVGIALSRRPHLILQLKLLSLLYSRIWLLSIALEPSVAHNFVYHRN